MLFDEDGVCGTAAVDYGAAEDVYEMVGLVSKGVGDWDEDWKGE